jgi:hypothetical protein
MILNHILIYYAYPSDDLRKILALLAHHSGHTSVSACLIRSTLYSKVFPAAVDR